MGAHVCAAYDAVRLLTVSTPSIGLGSVDLCLRVVNTGIDWIHLLPPGKATPSFTFRQSDTPVDTNTYILKTNSVSYISRRSIVPQSIVMCMNENGTVIGLGEYSPVRQQRFDKLERAKQRKSAALAALERER